MAGLTAEPLVVEHAGATLTVLPEPGGAMAALRGSLRDGHMGVSAPHEGLGALPAAVAEAREALDVAWHFDRSSTLRHFEGLGPLRMLARVPVSELTAFYREVLAPLDALSEEFRKTPLATLELLLATGLNVAETARSGGWHYNTVRYRVARLIDLLGPFTQDCPTLEARRAEGRRTRCVNLGPGQRRLRPRFDHHAAGGHHPALRRLHPQRIGGRLGVECDEIGAAARRRLVAAHAHDGSGVVAHHA